MSSNEDYNALDSDIAEELARMTPGRQQQQRPQLRRVREPRALEDLYQLFPGLGSGAYCLRVERKQPQTYGGRRIAGWLRPDVYQRITMEEFHQRYGGGTYDVSVRGPAPGGQIESGDQVSMVTLKTIKLEVQGAPRMFGAEEETTMDNNNHPQVAMKRIEQETTVLQHVLAEKERLQNKLESQSRGSSALEPSMFDVLSREAARQTEQVKALADQNLALLRQEVEVKNGQLIERDKLIEELRRELYRATTETAQRVKAEEERRLAELKELHREQSAMMAREHSEKLSKMNDEHRKALDETTRRHLEERQRAEIAAQQERERLREEFDRRERQLKSDAETRERNLKEMYERQLTDRERQFERELKQANDQRDRDVQMIRMNEESKLTTKEHSFQVNEASLKNELSRLRDELAARNREVETLKRQVYKPIPEAIAEAHQLAALTGMVAKDDLPEPADEGEFDWKKALFTMGKSVVEQIPNIAERMEQVRAHNQAAQAQVRQQQRHPQAAMQHVPPPGYVPAAPPAWGEAGPPDPASDFGLPPADGPIVAPPPPPPPPKPKQQRTGLGANVSMPRKAAPPLAGQEPTGETMAARESDPAPQVVQAPQHQPAQPPAQPVHAPTLEISEAQLLEFFGHVEDAINMATDPKQFAQLVIAQAGREQAKALAHQVDPDNFIAVAERMRGTKGTPISTRNGRQFVHEVWKAVRAA